MTVMPPSDRPDAAAHVRPLEVGRPWASAILDAIRALQNDDPLSSVTVLVPSNTAGLSLRRLFGSGVLDDPSNQRGIINVAFSTPFQLASILAAPTLARGGQRPLTTAVLAAAIRHVLRTEESRFASVAGHIATETALVRTYAEITELSVEQRTRLAANGSPRTVEVLALVDAVERHLAHHGGGHHDESAVFDTATGVLADPSSPPLGAIVFADPLDTGPASQPFVRALAATQQTRSIVAMTGDPDVDTDTLAKVAQRQGLAPMADTQVEPPPAPRALVPAADADDECRIVVRRTLALMADGVPLHRIAVFHPVAEPYARTLREHFEAASVPTAGPDHRTLGDSMVGRLLRRLLTLALADRSGLDAFDRPDVLALVESAPLRGATGRQVRSDAWENISRRAGVIGGIDDWRTKLVRFGDARQIELDDPRHTENSAGWFDVRIREVRATAELLAFVEMLYESTRPERIGSSWAERSNWARGLLAALLPQANRRSRWPEEEVVAAERIEVALGRVGVLDDVDPDAEFSSFVRAVELELSGPSGSRGRFGRGVHVGPLAGAIGLDFDHVFVVGMAEGVCPRPIREDTLLPDDQRAIVAPDLPQRGDRLLLERRRYLHAISAGGEGVVLTTPLGDGRNGRDRAVSRWWLESLRRLGAPDGCTSEDWAEHRVAGVELARSFTGAFVDAASTGVVMSRADAGLADTVAAGPIDADPATLPGPVSAGATMLRSRHLEYGPHTGLVTIADAARLAITDDVVVSASRLETWANCPRKYLFSYGLGLGQIDAPDIIAEISALERGSLVHAILERFIAETLPGQPHAPSSPGAPWTAADRNRLHAHADVCFDEWERRGLTGRPILWAIEKERIGVDLDRFLSEDSANRAERATTPHAVELAIGFDAADVDSVPPARFELDDGRVVAFRGFADRIDTRGDGSPVVIDYKTGGSKLDNKKAQTRLGEDPVAGGTKLQLGVYAQAAMQAFDRPRAAAHYFYVSQKGNFDIAGYEFTSAHRRRFVDALTVIVDGIGAGVFPPNPGPWSTFGNTNTNCRYCDFDAICTRDRLNDQELALDDPQLSGWSWLKDPDPFIDAAGEW